MSSPVAVALVVAADSLSVVAPIFKVVTTVLLALENEVKSPKSEVCAITVPLAENRNSSALNNKQ
jgi:hypothetical protein